MKICTWNVNSIRQRAHPSHDRLSPWLKEHAPDVVCLQELQCTTAQFPHAAIAQAGYRALLSTQKGKNGVALLTRLDAPKPVAVTQAWPPESAVTNDGPAPWDEARFVAGRCGNAVVASVYVPYGRGPEDPQWVSKLRFFDALKKWSQEVLQTGQCLLIAGDFNVAPTPSDATSTDSLLISGVQPPEIMWAPWCHPHMRRALQSLMSVGMQDVGATLPPSSRTFTMWDTRNFGPNTRFGVRVDLILASLPMANRLTRVEVHSPMRHGVKPSDHVPVMAQFRDIDRIYGALSGSRLYGLATATSDTDVQGLFLPSRNDLLLGRVDKQEQAHRGKAAGEKNNAQDVDIRFFSPTTFVHDLMTGQPCAWELLFAPAHALTQDTSPLGARFMDHLRRNSHLLWPKNLASVVGFADRNRNKYLRQFMPKQGKPVTELHFADGAHVGEHGKLLSHALRVLQQAQEMQNNGTMLFPRPNVPQLMAIKLGFAPAQETLNEVARLRGMVLQDSDASADLQPDDDSFGYACARALHDEHLLMSRWFTHPPLMKSLSPEAKRLPQQLAALDLASGRL